MSSFDFNKAFGKKQTTITKKSTTKEGNIDVPKIKIIYFEGDKWSRKVNGEWVNISKLVKTKADQDTYVKGMINERLEKINELKELNGHTLSKEDKVTMAKVNAYFAKLNMNTIYDNIILLNDINRKKIEFLDCIVDLDTGKSEFRKDRKTDFTPYQIRFEIGKTYQTFIDKPLKMTPEQRIKKDLVDRFFKEVSNNDKDMETSLLEVIGSTMAPVNDSIFPIFYSPHRSSGKGTIIEIISNLNNLTREIKGDKWWGVNSSQFALSNIRNQLAAFIDEVPSRLPQSSTETIKRYADSKEYLEIERKSIDQEQTLNTLTFLATTNKRTKFYSIDDSLKGRVMWYDFEMNNDKSKNNKFTKDEIKTITKDKECLQYIALRAISMYGEVVKRIGDRNQVFTKPKSNNEFWDLAEEDNIAIDIIANNEKLAGLWDAKDIHIPTALIKTAVLNYKIENKDDLPKGYNTMTFKYELIDYIHANNLGKAVVKSYKNTKGIKIDWLDKGDK